MHFDRAGSHKLGGAVMVCGISIDFFFAETVPFDMSMCILIAQARKKRLSPFASEVRDL